VVTVEEGSTLADSIWEIETNGPITPGVTPIVWKRMDAVSTPFASAAENIAGAIENKAVDPLGIREAFNATGTAPVYACRAWVNLNGSGTVAILSSGNVSSITDNGVGDYTANFTTALPGADYSICGTAGNGTNSALLGIFPGANFSRLVGSCRIQTAASAGLQDCSITSLAFFR
jgi:hypothetical protein